MKPSHIFLALSIIFALSSCKTKHDLAYFTDIEDQTHGLLETQQYTTKIEPESELIIIVKSKEMAASAPFNLPYINPVTDGTTETQSTPKQQTYMVDDKGNINFPVLGTIHVEGMTIYELRDYLIDRLKQYLKEPMVTVSAVAYQISVIGEVGVPKTI